MFVGPVPTSTDVRYLGMPKDRPRVRNGRLGGTQNVGHLHNGCPGFSVDSGVLIGMEYFTRVWWSCWNDFQDYCSSLSPWLSLNTMASFRNLRALVIETKHGDPRPKHSTHMGPDLLNPTVFLAETHSCAELVLLVHPVAHAKIASSSRWISPQTGSKLKNQSLNHQFWRSDPPCLMLTSPCLMLIITKSLMVQFFFIFFLGKIWWNSPFSHQLQVPYVPISPFPLDLWGLLNPRGPAPKLDGPAWARLPLPGAGARDPPREEVAWHCLSCAVVGHVGTLKITEKNMFFVVETNLPARIEGLEVSKDGDIVDNWWLDDMLSEILWIITIYDLGNPLS